MLARPMRAMPSPLSCPLILYPCPGDFFVMSAKAPNVFLFYF